MSVFFDGEVGSVQSGKSRAGDRWVVLVGNDRVVPVVADRYDIISGEVGRVAFSLGGVVVAEFSLGSIVGWHRE